MQGSFFGFWSLFGLFQSHRVLHQNLTCLPYPGVYAVVFFYDLFSTRGRSLSKSVWPTEAGPIRYRRKKSGGGYIWVEAVGHSVGGMTGTKPSISSAMIPLTSPMASSSSGESSSVKVAAQRLTLVFSERDISRYIELEAKLARQQGRSLMQALDQQDRASSAANLHQVFRIEGGGVGHSTRQAAAASAGGFRR